MVGQPGDMGRAARAGWTSPEQKVQEPKRDKVLGAENIRVQTGLGVFS